MISFVRVLPLAVVPILLTLPPPSPARAAIGIASTPLTFYSGAHGLVSKLDIVYDQTNENVATWCTFSTICLGQFLDLNARPIGAAFPITSPAGFIRVAWGSGGFVIAYTPSSSRAARSDF